MSLKSLNNHLYLNILYEFILMALVLIIGGTVVDVFVLVDHMLLLDVRALQVFVVG